MPHCLLLYSISIHAPTKGATKSFTYCTTSSAYFNPRSHEGSDFRFQTNDQGRLHFNPRSHEGSDKAAHISIVCGQLFQSTLPRRERRETSLHLMHICAISIHAPTKGATSHMTDTVHDILFQSTLPRRERHSHFLFFKMFHVFQSTLPRRERLGEVSKTHRLNRFQSTLPRRERQKWNNRA